MEHRESGRDAGNANDGANRDVNAARNDDDRLGRGDQAKDRDRIEDVREVARLKKDLGLGRAEDCDEDGERDNQTEILRANRINERDARSE